MKEDEYDNEVELQTGVAQYSASEMMDAPLRVSGVAIGEDEITRTKEGQKKVWPREALEVGTETLEGVQLTKNHEHDKVEGVIGKVVSADYKPGVGILFEAEVYDEDVAEKIEQDLLEVSIHALHTVSHLDDEGRMVVERMMFLDLSVVPRGEAQSNTVAPGTLATAALGRTELSELTEESFGDGKSGRDSEEVVNTDDAHEGADGSLQTDEAGTESPSDTVLADSESTIESDDGEVADSSEESTQSFSAEGQTVNDTDMTDENNPEVGEEELEEATPAEEEVSDEELDEVEDAESEAEEVELEEETESEAEVDFEARVAELEEQNSVLREENEALLNKVEDVRMEYADALSAGSAFSAEELADKFSADELATKYEETDEVTLTESTASPAPQTGTMSETEEEELEAEPDTDFEAEVARLESQIEQYDDMGWEGAQEAAEASLAELRDE